MTEELALAFGKDSSFPQAPTDPTASKSSYVRDLKNSKLLSCPFILRNGRAVPEYRGRRSLESEAPASSHIGLSCIVFETYLFGLEVCFVLKNEASLGHLKM